MGVERDEGVAGCRAALIGVVSASRGKVDYVVPDGEETDRGARIITAGHGFVQNIRRGHYELGVEEPTTLRVVDAFTELALTI